MLRPLGVDRRALRGIDLKPGSRPGSEIALAWFWVMAWIAVVQIFASDSFSAGETSHIVRPLLRWLFPDASPQWIATAHFTIRKISHFVVYAILALFAWPSIDRRSGLPRRASRWHSWSRRSMKAARSLHAVAPARFGMLRST
jgi:hypothetical protein